MTPYEALKGAIDKAGGQNAFARKGGVPQSTVWKWLHKSKKAPAEKVLLIEDITGVSRHKLRPDLYPIENKKGRPSDAH